MRGVLLDFLSGTERKDRVVEKCNDRRRSESGKDAEQMAMKRVKRP